MATITIHPKNVEDCCRTCLTDATFKMYDIFEYRNDFVNAAEMLSSCTSITVSRDDKLPKQLCASCYMCVGSFYDFKKIAEKNDKSLRYHLEDQKPVIDDSMLSDKGNQIIKIENDNFESAADYDLDDSHEAKIKTEDKNSSPNLENIDNLQRTKYLKHEVNDFKENQHGNCEKNPQNYKDDQHTKKFECNACSANFKQLYQYVKHLVEHSEGGNLKSHVTEVNQNDTNQRFQCDICGSNFKSINSLSAHKRKHAKKGRILSCSLCNKVFPKLSHLKRHELCHEHNRPYKCSMCKKSFATENVLAEHINKHNGVKPYGCPICSERFAHQSGLSNHIKVHMKQKSYLCSACGKKFNTSTGLNQHLKRHTGIRKYACNLCPKTFVSKGELKRHSKIHSGERTYECDICSASFVQSSGLRNHNLVHLGIKPFHCDKCSMKFKSNYHLQRHYRIHSGERPYRCEMCDRAFTQSNDLEKHRRSHLGDNLYKCSECLKSFRLKTELRQHISEHYVSSQNVAPSAANNDRSNVVTTGENDEKVDSNDTELQNGDMVVNVSD